MGQPRRKRRFESLLAALSRKITTADRSERLHHERRHYTESGWKSRGLATSAGNQSSSAEKNQSKLQLKGSKQQISIKGSGQGRKNKISSQLRRDLEAVITSHKI